MFQKPLFPVDRFFTTSGLQLPTAGFITHAIVDGSYGFCNFNLYLCAKIIHNSRGMDTQNRAVSRDFTGAQLLSNIEFDQHLQKMVTLRWYIAYIS